MKSYHKLLFPLLLASLLCGCTVSVGGNANSKQTGESSQASSAADQQTGNSGAVSDSGIRIDANMPMLVIETVSQDPNVMDFIKKPVAGHVSKLIASWTPGYTIPPEPYYEACKVYMTTAKDSGTPAAVDADVKVRGNWTTNYDKKPLKLKFAEKTSLAQLADGEGFKNWLLLAGYNKN